MKKLLVVLLALVMVFSMTTFAFAAYGQPEPTAEEVPATDAEGNEVTVEVDSLPYYDEAAQEVRSAEGAEDLVESLDLADEVEESLVGTGYAVEDLTILSPLEVTLEGNASDVNWPIDVELPAPGAKVGDKTVVLHKGADGWRVVPSKVEKDDTTTATFNGLSPVVVLLATGEGTGIVAKYEDYTDLEADAWYKDYVTYVVERGLMGVDSTEFGPDWATLRGDFATVLCRAEKSLDGQYPEYGYTDIADAADYMVTPINWASVNLMQGDNGLFRPNDPITRQEVFTVFRRMADLYGVAGETYATDLSKFDDVADVADWALDAVTWGVASGLIEGDDGSLCPTRNITRAELATLITRWYTEINN